MQSFFRIKPDLFSLWLIFSVISLMVLPACKGSTETMEQPQPTPEAKLQITHLGNQGVLIQYEDQKVIIDGLHNAANSNFWSKLAAADMQQAESAQGAFNDVDLLLVTHNHSDHYNGTSVGRHLQNNANARFYSLPAVRATVVSGTPAIASQVISPVDPANDTRASVSMNGIDVEVLNMHHFVPVCGECGRNYAYIITLNDIRILHLGDIDMLDSDNISSFPLAQEDIDIVFVATPFASFVTANQAAALRSWINPKKVVALHINNTDKSQIITAVNTHYPDASILSNPLQKISFAATDFE